jgi:hypothetical protein
MTLDMSRPRSGALQDNLSRLIFEALDPFFSEDMCHDFDDLIHDTFLGFL